MVEGPQLPVDRDFKRCGARTCVTRPTSQVKPISDRSFLKISTGSRSQLSRLRRACRGCRRPHQGRPLRDQGQSALGGKAHAPQTSGRSSLHNYFWCFLHRPRRSVRCQQAAGISARQRHRSARQNTSLSLGKIRRVRQPSTGHRSAGPRIFGFPRRSAE